MVFSSIQKANTIKYYLVMLFLVGCFIINAQSTEVFFLGRIVDANNGQPVPFVSISILNQNKGVISNEEGDFRFLIKPQNTEDTLVISSIGYERLFLPLKYLNDTIIREIEIWPAVYKLDEIEITEKQGRNLSSRRIVRRAIRNIPENISSEDSRSVSYFRTYLKNDQVYYNLNEALIYTVDHGIDEKVSKNDDYLLDYQINDKFEYLNLDSRYGIKKHTPGVFIVDFGGNEYKMLSNNNAIKNYTTRTFSYVNNFKEDFIVNHNFKDASRFRFNDKSLYKIPFNTEKKQIVYRENELRERKILATGNIYIEPVNYRIHKLEYFVKSIDGIKERDLYDFVIEYGIGRDEYMNLKYISFNNLIVADDPNDEFVFRPMAYSINYKKKTIYIIFSNEIDSICLQTESDFSVYINDYYLDYNTYKIEGNMVALNCGRRMIDVVKTIYKGDGKDEIRVYTDVQDIDGRMNYSTKEMQLNQYRELFVIDNNPVEYRRLNNKLSDKPLEQNVVNEFMDKDKYWMNSPIGIREILNQ